MGSTMLAEGIVIALVLALSIGAVAMFNRIQRLRNLADASWSDVDVQLKRRHDLVPSLVEVVRAYAEHEAEVIESVATARARAARARGEAALEGAFTNALVRVFALGESYPALLAEPRFARLHADLVAIEDDLQAARRYFNAVVRDHNNAVQTFPGLLIASAIGAAPRAFFELDAADASLPPVVRSLAAPSAS